MIYHISFDGEKQDIARFRRSIQGRDSFLDMKRVTSEKLDMNVLLSAEDGAADFYVLVEGKDAEKGMRLLQKMSPVSMNFEPCAQNFKDLYPERFAFRLYTGLSDKYPALHKSQCLEVLAEDGSMIQMTEGECLSADVPYPYGYYNTENGIMTAYDSHLDMKEVLRSASDSLDFTSESMVFALGVIKEAKNGTLFTLVTDREHPDRADLYQVSMNASVTSFSKMLSQKDAKENTFSECILFEKGHNIIKKAVPHTLEDTVMMFRKENFYRLEPGSVITCSLRNPNSKDNLYYFNNLENASSLRMVIVKAGHDGEFVLFNMDDMGNYISDSKYPNRLAEKVFLDNKQYVSIVEDKRLNDKALGWMRDTFRPNGILRFEYSMNVARNIDYATMEIPSRTYEIRHETNRVSRKNEPVKTM
jgi:hypothetical protein